MKPDEVVVDELGPRMVAYLSDPDTGLDACVVVDNTSAGVAIGGVRMDAHVDARTVVRLARAMTWKNAAAGIPHGGAKAGIRADPSMPVHEKERLVRAFARAIRDLREYVPGPDIGTDERCMGWVFDEIGRAVARPRVLGGIPLDEIGATGFGLAVCADALAAAGRLSLQGARIAVQGFGAVGTHSARHLSERGAKLVAVSDRSGSIGSPTGIDVAALIAYKQAVGTVHGFPGSEPLGAEGIIGVDCDVLVPAAQADVITSANVDLVRASVVLQGANIPASADAELSLHQRGVLCVPDFVANAGGVICAAVEFGGGSESSAFGVIADRITRTTHQMLDTMEKLQLPPRAAAEHVAFERLSEAASYRGGHAGLRQRRSMPI
jgi:glutamate dehydrogenase/leucine dehydrogenase